MSSQHDEAPNGRVARRPWRRRGRRTGLDRTWGAQVIAQKHQVVVRKLCEATQDSHILCIVHGRGEIELRVDPVVRTAEQPLHQCVSELRLAFDGEVVELHSPTDRAGVLQRCRRIRHGPWLAGADGEHAHLPEAASAAVMPG